MLKEKTVEKDTNKVILSGTIVNKYETNKVIILTLGITQFIKGLKGEPKKVSNYPKVYFFKSDETGADKFMLHDKVKVTAHVASSKKRHDNGDPYVSQALVGDLAEDVKTILEAEVGTIKGGGYEPNMNVVYLNGQVKEIKQVRDNVTSFVMEAMNKGKLNIVTVTSFSKKDCEKVHVKDTITVIGSMYTKKKVYNDKNFFYENVVAQRITVEV